MMSSTCVRTAVIRKPTLDLVTLVICHPFLSLVNFGLGLCLVLLVLVLRTWSCSQHCRMVRKMIMIWYVRDEILLRPAKGIGNFIPWAGWGITERMFRNFWWGRCVWGGGRGAGKSNNRWANAARGLNRDQIIDVSMLSSSKDLVSEWACEYMVFWSTHESLRKWCAAPQHQCVLFQ